MNIKSTRQIFYRYRLPILAGFLIGTSYIPLYPWALFFGLVPLLLFWRSTTGLRESFIGGWITQFILNLIGFHWIASTAIEFGHFPTWAGVLTLLGFATIAHLYYPVAGLLGAVIAKKVHLHPLARIAITASIFAICDYTFPKIFPWHFGYPWLWANWPGAQLADVIGFQGLNAVTIAVNVLIALAIATGLFSWKTSSPQSRRTAALSAISAIVLVGAINILGFGRNEKWRATDAEVKVLAVQGNIGNFDKLLVEKGSAFRLPVIAKYLQLSREGLARFPETDLMIWPETAFPDVLDQPYIADANQLRVRMFAHEINVPILTGAYSVDRAKNQTYNGLFFINSDFPSTVFAPYRKSILLVFGETFPFSEYIPYEKILPDLGSFGHGDGPHVISAPLKTGPVNIGQQICYEGLYPWFTVDLAKQGAEIIANVTNDSWFGSDFEPYQHLYMTLARAIEVRRPLIRSTNTGITTAILADGEILPGSPIGKEWTGEFRIPYRKNPEHTTFEKVSSLWIWFLCAILLSMLAVDRWLMRAKGK